MSASEVREQLRIDPRTRRTIDTRRELTENYPFSIGVGMLEFQQYSCKNGKLTLSNCIGTGTLISEDMVLTCAHNVINREVKNDKRITNQGNKVSKFANSIGITFTLNDEEVGVESFVECPNYLSDKEFDYALLKLENQIEIDDDFLQLGIMSDSSLSNGGRRYYVVGHKDDMLVYDYGGLCSYSDQTIDYRIATNNGQSGGPVVTYINEEWMIVGVHSRGVREKNGNVKNSAVRINGKVGACIQEIVSELE